MFSATEINAAVAAGRTVTARSTDLRRRGQPSHAVEVVVTEAWDNSGSLRVTARGYKGRFRAEIVRIVGEDFQTSPCE